MKFILVIAIFLMSAGSVSASCYPHNDPALLEELYQTNPYVFVANIRHIKILYAYADDKLVTYELTGPALKGEMPASVMLGTGACDPTVPDGQYLIFTDSVNNEAPVKVSVLLALPRVSDWTNEVALSWIRGKQPGR